MSGHVLNGTCLGFFHYFFNSVISVILGCIEIYNDIDCGSTRVFC